MTIFNRHKSRTAYPWLLNKHLKRPTSPKYKAQKKKKKKIRRNPEILSLCHTIRKFRNPEIQIRIGIPQILSNSSLWLQKLRYALWLGHCLMKIRT